MNIKKKTSTKYSFDNLICVHSPKKWRVAIELTSSTHYLRCAHCVTIELHHEKTIAVDMFLISLQSDLKKCCEMFFEVLYILKSKRSGTAQLGNRLMFMQASKKAWWHEWSLTFDQLPNTCQSLLTHPCFLTKMCQVSDISVHQNISMWKYNWIYILYALFNYDFDGGCLHILIDLETIFVRKQGCISKGWHGGATGQAQVVFIEIIFITDQTAAA